MPTPEELSRQQIDVLLQQCGWLTLDYKKLYLSAGSGIAIREVRLKKRAAAITLLIRARKVTTIRLIKFFNS